MNIDLTRDELIELMDCVGNRIDDLQDCAMFGDATEIEGEIENLQELANKLGDALESADPGLVICDAEINAETALKFVPPGPLGAKASRSEIQDHDLWEKPANDPVDW